MRRSGAGALVAVVLVAGQAAAQRDPMPAPRSAEGGSSSWLWVAGALAGAAGLAGLAVLAYLKRRPADASPARASPVVAPKPAPTEPGEPAVANPFAPLPDTRLMIVRGLPVEDRFYRLSTSPFLVGASAGNHLVVDAPHVSGHHATLELLADGTVYLMDASRNGTYIDDTRVPSGERVRVNDGQRIAFSREVEVRLWQAWRAGGEAGGAAGSSEPVASPGEPNPARRPPTLVEPRKGWRDDR